MKNIALVTAIASIAFCATTIADDSTFVKTGTIQDIDFASSTLSVEHDNGKVEAYNFTQKTRTVVEGRSTNARQALKVGQQVELKFRRAGMKQASL